MGIESNELDAATEYLKLEQGDEEYKQMEKDYIKAIGDLKLG
jgi:hypothetical protein